MTPKSLRWSTLVYVLLFLFGISLIGWGTAISDSGYSILLTSLGGAVIGSSISCATANLKYLDFFLDIHRVLSESVRPGLTSNDHDIARHRELFHVYHVTQAEGQFVWRHTKADFSKSYAAGRLTGKVTQPGLHEKDQLYLIEAGFVDERFLVFTRPALGKEPTAIAIYPHFGKEYHGQHCGLKFLESWDATNIVAPCIISRTPIGVWTKTGTVGPEVAKELDRLWCDQFLQVNKVLPRVSHIALAQQVSSDC